MRTIGCVLVTHNRLELTKRTIATLRETTPADVRVVLLAWDNASTDGTMEWLRERAQDDPYMFVIPNEENVYPGAACNYGWKTLLEMSEQFICPSIDFLMMSDNDIVFLPGWVEAGFKILDAMPTMGQVGLLNNLQDVSPDQRESRIIRHEENGVIVNVQFPNVAGAFLLRKEVYEKGARWPEGAWSRVTWPAYHFGQAVRATGFDFCNVIENVAYENVWEDYEKNEQYYRRTFAERGVESLLDKRIAQVRRGEVQNGYVGGE